MSQALTVARLAVRELWMTFRLLLVLFGWVVAAAAVGILSAPPAVTLGRLAAGVGAATILGGVVAAWSLADERRTGRAGWLVTRSVARGTYLVGWFTALAATTAAGLAVALLLGWLALGAHPAVDLAGLSAALLAVGATAAAAIALGLLLGALFGRRLAAGLALIACVGTAVAAGTVGGGGPWLPGGAELVLARAAGPASVLPDALRAAGIGLALAAVLLVAARVALERTEL